MGHETKEAHVGSQIDTGAWTAWQGGGLTGALFAIAYGVIWLRGRLSSDSVERTRDKTENTILEIVLKERNEAMTYVREAMTKREADAKQIGELTAQVKGLEALNHKLNNEVQLLRLQMMALRREIARVFGKEPPLSEIENDMDGFQKDVAEMWQYLDDAAKAQVRRIIDADGDEKGALP